MTSTLMTKTSDYEIIQQPDGQKVLLIQRQDTIDVYFEDGSAVIVVGLDHETAWQLGRKLVRHWARSWFGLKLWWWRRKNIPRYE